MKQFNNIFTVFDRKAIKAILKTVQPNAQEILNL